MAATVGRDRECRQLVEALAGGALVAVLGPAGIGKTQVVQEALRRRPSITGTAVASLRWSPYLPLCQAANISLGGDPEAVAAIVLARADDRVLVVEDIQWADAGTLAVLDVLAQRLPIVVTARTEAGGQVEGDLARLLTTTAATRIALGPLDARAARALIARSHPELQAPAVALLLAAAGGSPLLLQQLPVLGVVSPTLHAALGARIDSVPPRVRHQLLVLAIAGHPLPAAEVIAAVDHPATSGLLHHHNGEVQLGHARLGEVLVALAAPAEQRNAHGALAKYLNDPLLNAVHLLASGREEAAGWLAQSALDDETDASRRAQLLKVVAQSGLDRSGRATVAAAAALFEVGAWDEAVNTAGGLEGGEADTQAEAHLVAGLAHWAAGRPHAAKAELAVVATLVPATSLWALKARVEAASQAGRAHPGPKALAEAVATLKLAEAAGFEVGRARGVVGQAMMFTGQPGWGHVLRTVTAEARRAGDDHTELSAAFALVSGLGFSGNLPAAIGESRAVLARLAPQPFGTWHAHFAGALVVYGVLTSEPRDEVVALARRLLGERPLFRNRAQVDMVLVAALADAGRVEEAEAALRDAKRLARGDEDRSLLLVGEAELGWAAGDGDRVRRAASEADRLEHEWFGVTAILRAITAYAAFAEGRPVPERAPAPTLPVIATTTVEHRALLAWSQGDSPAALAGLDAATEAWDAVHLYRFAARSRWAAAELAVRSGDESARRRAQAAASAAARFALTSLTGRTERTLAMATTPRTAPLTPRERQVLGLVAAGLTSSAIARQLGIGTSTVESHLRSARQKLGARTRWQAASAVGTRG